MTSRYSLASVGALIGVPTRAAILLELMSGKTLPASELARVAECSAPAVSLHLAKLTQAGLLAVRREGRHRFYRLAHREVAHALEALGLIATAPSPRRPPSPEREALRNARTCYDHLAGAISVALAEALERARILTVRDERAFDVTPYGARWFAERFEIDFAALTQRRRPLAKRCLDWTERKPHLAGALGATLLV